MASSSFLIIDQHKQLFLPLHADHIVISDDSGYGIQEIRKVIEKSYRKPFNKKHQIIFIRQAQNLSIEAQNALLKVIEEPSPSTIVILSVINPEHLLPTIRSRCELLSLETFQQLKKNKDLAWTSEFQLEQPTHKDQHEIPQTPVEAFAYAEELAKEDRGVVIEKLEEWLQTLSTEPVKNLHAMEVILDAKEAIAHNAHMELALDVLFAHIAQQASQK